MIRRITSALRQKLRRHRAWYFDLCEYYGVTPKQALQLGTRATGRRPDLPGSATTHPVIGHSYEEIWEGGSRETPAEIDEFWRDMGAWATFRQVVYHRSHSFQYVRQEIQPGTRLCEYGAGVAPVCNWLIEHLQRISVELTIVDVPSEHLAFGAWRLQRRIEALKSPITLHVREVLPDKLPLEDNYDIITVLEVYEHLRNPSEVTIHLCDHLRRGGLLWENYIVHNHPHASDLEVAQRERPQVFAYLNRHFELMAGNHPDAPDGGGTRCWRKL